MIQLRMLSAGDAWRGSRAGGSLTTMHRPNLGDRSIASADLLIVLGGPIGVYDTSAFPFLSKEIELLDCRLAMERPTIRICSQ